MAKDTEVRTYNVRDEAGYLDFSTDDLGALIAHLDGRTGRYSIDDFDEKDLRAQHKRAVRVEASTQKENARIAKEREQAIKARGKELAASIEIVANAVAALEHDLGRLSDG